MIFQKAPRKIYHRVKLFKIEVYIRWSYPKLQNRFIKEKNKIPLILRQF